MTSMRKALRIGPGTPPGLAARDPRATPGAPGDKTQTATAFAETAGELAALQERLYAEATAGGRRRVLVVLQGMDTSGKGGTIKHVVGLLDPVGCRVASFKRPTVQELRHHFLWRIRKQVPVPGFVGIFDRSHYEDVLIARVHELVPAEQIERRYEEINAFERKLAADGVTLLKCMLHISPEVQRERLLARLDEPDKRWKFNEGDLTERALWPQYEEAYTAALQRCSTDVAPWYVVPAGRKWFRNYAVQQLLLETLRELDPRFPAREDLDVPVLKARLKQD